MDGFDPENVGNTLPSLDIYGLQEGVENWGHQFSLPNSSTSQMITIENNAAQDCVPFKIRAKRGFATHPRSIAERVRRTRISERMRKLQELVPSMEKQTNIADMLDEAAEYIKFLQRQVQELSLTQCNCNGCFCESNPNG